MCVNLKSIWLAVSASPSTKPDLCWTLGPRGPDWHPRAPRCWHHQLHCPTRHPPAGRPRGCTGGWINVAGSWLFKGDSPWKKVELLPWKWWNMMEVSSWNIGCKGMWMIVWGNYSPILKWGVNLSINTRKLGNFYIGLSENGFGKTAKFGHVWRTLFSSKAELGACEVVTCFKAVLGCRWDFSKQSGPFCPFYPHEIQSSSAQRLASSM